MTGVVAILRRIYDFKSEAPADLSGLEVAADKEGLENPVRLPVDRLVSTQISEVVGDSIVAHVTETYTIKPEDIEDGDFDIELTNYIAINYDVDVDIKGQDYHPDIGFSYDKEVSSRYVTIHVNSEDNSHYQLKAGWNIFIDYYYLKAVPNSPQNPPEEESAVSLVNITHQWPDYAEGSGSGSASGSGSGSGSGSASGGGGIPEYNNQNDVQFILHFINMSSQTESLNLELQLIESEYEDTIYRGNITVEVPPGSSTFEKTFLGLGQAGDTTTYDFLVTGDREGEDSVTVPALAANFVYGTLTVSRTANEEVRGTQQITNDGNLAGLCTIYFWLGSGDKFPASIWLEPGETKYLNYSMDCTTSAQTVTTFESNQSTQIQQTSVGAVATTEYFASGDDYTSYGKSIIYPEGQVINPAMGTGDGAFDIGKQLVAGNYYVTRGGFRLKIPTDLTGVSKVILYMPIYLRQNDFDINNVKVYKCDGDIETLGVYDLYFYGDNTDWTGSVEEIPNLSLPSQPLLKLTLASAAHASFNNNADGYIDLWFKSGDESSLSKIGFYVDNPGGYVYILHT